MKYITYSLWSLLILAACVACDKNDEETPETVIFGEPITLKIGETAEIETSLSINFVDVVEDSRCPKGAECFWEGQARVELQVNNSDKIAVTMRVAHEDLAKDTLNDLVYTLLSVLPETTTDGAIVKEDYVIEIQVDEL